VHELGHRSHPYTAAQAERAALHSTPAIAVGVAGTLIGTALFLVQFPFTRPGLLHYAMTAFSGSCFALAAVLATIWGLAHIIAANARAERFASEFAADDYATALQGASRVPRTH